MSAKFEVNYDQIAEIERKLSSLPRKTEEVINEVLHQDGIEIATEEITKLLPVSRSRNRVRNKQHAKTSKWSKSEKHNLGFTIKAKGGAANKRGSFGYLVFPNEGRGAHNLIEQRFMERGLEKATPRILERLNEKIEKVLREEL